jgi:hypothetical protein
MTEPPKITGKRPRSSSQSPSRSPSQLLTWDNTYHSPEQYNFLEEKDLIKGTTHMYKLTYILLENVLDNKVEGRIYQSNGSFQSDELSDFPNELKRFDITRPIPVQQIGNTYKLDDKETYVINSYIVTKGIKEIVIKNNKKEEIQLYKIYIWDKTPSSRINKSVSRIDRKRARKLEKILKRVKPRQTQSAGSISRKTRRQRSNKTRKSR